MVGLAAWEVVSRLAPPSVAFLIPGPSKVAIETYGLIVSGQMLSALAASLMPLAVALLVVLGVGIPYGILMGISRKVEQVSDFYIYSLYASPVTALIPVIMLYFGAGFAAKVVVIIIYTVFDVIMILFQGAKNVPASYIEVAESMGARNLQIFTKVVMWHLLPYILTAVRIALGRGIRGMIVAELLISATGLGWLISAYSAALRIDAVLGVAIVIMIMGIGVQELIKRLESRLMPWAEMYYRR
ncbi:MAG: ABC transporter permease subunit [Nitrososphaerota archaeon]